MCWSWHHVLYTVLRSKLDDTVFPVPDPCTNFVSLLQTSACVSRSALLSPELLHSYPFYLEFPHCSRRCPMPSSSLCWRQGSKPLYCREYYGGGSWEWHGIAFGIFFCCVTYVLPKSTTMAADADTIARHLWILSLAFMFTNHMWYIYSHFL
jgi:hypothetical protein